MEDLSIRLTEPKLRSSLETAQVIYSMTSAVWRACAKRIDVRGIWKNDLQPSLSRFVQWQRDRRSEVRSEQTEFSKFLTGVISPVDNAAVAAQTGITVRGFGEYCWAICDGQSGCLLVNYGKFHGKNITAVMLRFPEAAIFEWDERDQSYYVLSHRRLSHEELEIVRDPMGREINSPKSTSTLVSAKQTARTLLEVCTEGGGHSERQLALLPQYKTHGTVHVAASGDRALSWAQEQWAGHRILYDTSGKVRSAATLVSYFKRLDSISRQARIVAGQLEMYTHAITDFAPILPLAMRLARKAGQTKLPKLFHVSHHVAMHSRYVESPKPPQLDRLTYWATQRYQNSINGDVNIGFHFERYHQDILTPPLAPDILSAKPTFNSKIILVYLNGSPFFLAEQCAKIDPSGDHEWHIYSAQQKVEERSVYPHIWLFPQSHSYRDKIPRARGVLTVSGFMGPAELLHLGKPFVVLPTPGHGEHAFNASALQEISDVSVVTLIDSPLSHSRIRSTFGEAKSLTAPLVRVGRKGSVGPYIDVRAEVVRRIFGS